MTLSTALATCVLILAIMMLLNSRALQQKAACRTLPHHPVVTLRSPAVRSAAVSTFSAPLAVHPEIGQVLYSPEAIHDCCVRLGK